jgi:hypothetical protein
MKIMSVKIIIITLVFSLISGFTVPGYADVPYTQNVKNLGDSKQSINSNYGIQWMKNYGPDQTGGRYQGMQPYGDCDNDGRNELLIGGRDATLSVMEWDEQKQTYEQTHALHSPFYPYFLLRHKLTGIPPPNPGGFAIGDVTGDGENEIVATWYGAVYKYINGNYRIIGLNSWIFRNGGANGDCCIGDCDNDGRNEVIMSGGAYSRYSPVPEIVILKWNGRYLEKVAVHDDPAFGYAFMADLGDPDDDGENEIVYGVSSFEQAAMQGRGNKVVVLDWSKTSNTFTPTVIEETFGLEQFTFGGWCADSDMDGIDEIHVGYTSPRIRIFEYHDDSYSIKFEKEWPGERELIEGINIGDVDEDGIPEVCAGTDIVHILQWDGSTYIEEAVIDQTYGELAVVNVGDFDNDGKNEINVAPVYVEEGMDYIVWIFKYV